LQQAKSRSLPPAEIILDYSGHESKIGAIEPFIGQAGELSLSLFTVESLGQAEDYLLFTGITEAGQVLEEETVRRLFSLQASSVLSFSAPSKNGKLEEIVEQRTSSVQRSISERNAKFFGAEAEKLDGWAEDLKVALEREIKDFDRQIKEAKRAATLALSLEEKLEGQKQIKALESQRNGKRRALFDAQDEIDRRREQLIAEIEGKLRQRTSLIELLRIRWQLA
jgi:adenine-specific DNA-methyltransferase